MTSLPRLPWLGCGASGLGLGCSLTLAAACLATPAGVAAPAGAQVPPPRVEANGGLRFQSQGGGTPNSFSGYLFAPLSQGTDGNLLFLDLSASLNLGGALMQQNDVNAGVSTRLGYRWLSGDRQAIYGINAGVDTRQAYDQYAFQAGVGAEALRRNLELRINGTIPFANRADLYASGWSDASLSNNRLLLDGWERYVVSLGGVDLEAGLPLARWGRDSLWLYGAYYYLTGDYLTGSSGVRGRAELRVGSQLSLGATVSYDDIFELQATGYLRYGGRPLAGQAQDAIEAAERDFLALRGLPVQRETDIRMVSAQQDLPGTVATDPSSGAPWVVRCSGATTNTATGQVRCDPAYADNLVAMIQDAGQGDLLLVGGGAAADLRASGVPSDAQGRPTLRLPAGSMLIGNDRAPTLATQFGPANLSAVFGRSVGPRPTYSNGVLSMGSRTMLSGFDFSNASITNHGRSKIRIVDNQFVGSYTDNPTALATAAAYGAINVSANALPAIQLQAISDVAIAGNQFLYPQVQTYLSQAGEGGLLVCNQSRRNPSGLCLSANAIRLNDAADATIAGNTVVGALDEAFRIQNPSGRLRIRGNRLSAMRMGPDSNIGSAIIVGQNRGSSNVEIVDNIISDNGRGVYSVVSDPNQVAVPVDANGRNVIDPIEIGLCRGSVSYPRAQDLYASPDFSGNCSGRSRMDLTISGNQISLPAVAGGRQEGDGIDLNIGANATLRASIRRNRILTLGTPDSANIGDNGLTFDVRGNSDVEIHIVGNQIENAGDAAIGFSLQNSTEALGQPGQTSVNLSANTFGVSVPVLVEADLVRNTGDPVSVFRFAGTGSNALIDANVQQRPFNPGFYPNLFVNGVQLFGQPAR